jgi:hypothetical protein
MAPETGVAWDRNINWIMRANDESIVNMNEYVPPPWNGRYEAEEAVQIIRALPKGTEYRSRAIDIILHRGCVVGRATLYARVMESEERDASAKRARMQPFKPRSVHTTSNVFDLGWGYFGNYIAPDVRPIVKWIGKIVLQLNPVDFITHGEIHEAYRKSGHRLSWGFRPIDICELIGNCDLFEPADRSWCETDENYSSEPSYQRVCARYGVPPLVAHFDPNDEDNRERLTKLYFSPKMFPAPRCKEMKKGFPSGISFGRLKEYIEQQADIGGSPVVCTGGSGFGEKRFKCKYWYRKQMDTKKRQPMNSHHKSCCFTFVVKWDEYGYYIPLLKTPSGRYNNGCAWHSCNGKIGTVNPKLGH